MKSLNGNFSSSDGVLRTDDRLIASPGLQRLEFNRGIGQQIASQESAPDFVLYGPVAIQLWGQRFLGGIRFFKDVLHGVTLTLEGGRVAALGYDATAKDLLSEKKMLTTLMSKQLGFGPSSTSLGADVFNLSWGGIISKADLKSSWCGIELQYN